MDNSNFPVEIGIDAKERESIVEGIARCLADSYFLYLKTQNYHWNVTGPNFQAMHLLFEQQYLDLASAVDLLAERIRTLGFPAPGTFAEFRTLTSIEEDTPKSKISFEDMVENLLRDHETVVRTTRSALDRSQKYSDEASSDLLTQRMYIHEKTAWMLRSLKDE